MQPLNYGIMAITSGGITASISSEYVDMYWRGDTGGPCDPGDGIVNITSNVAWTTSDGGGIFTPNPASGSAGVTAVTITSVPDTPPEDSYITFTAGTASVRVNCHNYAGGCE
jgi:hypothetical protein